MFEYSSFAIMMNTSEIEYSNVVLLKELCGKKAGTKINKIVFNPANGIFNIPANVKITAPRPKKPKVEFKGVHTRFEDEEVVPPSPVPEKKSQNKKEKTYTTVFKVYKGRCIHKVSEFDDVAYECVVDEIEKILEGHDLKNHITVDVNGCIVMCGVWNQFELKKRIKAGLYSFARVS